VSWDVFGESIEQFVQRLEAVHRDRTGFDDGNDAFANLLDGGVDAVAGDP